MQQEVWYKRSVSFFTETFQYWNSFRPTRIASSLSYYGLFALVPILVITFWIGSLLLQSPTLAADIIGRASYILGPASASFLQSTFQSSLVLGNHTLGAIITVIILFFLAITGFDQLKQALDEIWQTPEERTGNRISIIGGYFISFLATLSFGIAFIAFIVIARFFQAGFTFQIAAVTSQWITTIGGPIIIFIITVAGTFLAYAILPERKLPKRDLIIGALITGAFLTLGNVALGYYLTYGATLSTYGVAGSIVAILIWFYYSTLMFLFGACATWIYVKRQIIQ